MKYTLLFITALFCFSGIGLASELETSYVDLKGVDTLNFSGDIEVSLQTGENDQAVVEFNKKDKENVYIKLDRNKFTVRQKKTFWKFWNTSDTIKISVNTSVKTLKHLDVSGSVKVKSEKISTDNLIINGSGASYLNIYELNANKLDVRLSGASKLTIDNTKMEKFFLNMSGSSVTHINGEGSIKYSLIDITGSCHYQADKVITSDAKVKATGASTIKLYARDKLQAKLTGASKLSYSGSAQMDVHTTGASAISTF